MWLVLPNILTFPADRVKKHLSFSLFLFTVVKSRGGWGLRGPHSHRCKESGPWITMWKISTWKRNLCYLMPTMLGVYFLNQSVTNLTNAEHAISFARQGEALGPLETTFCMWTNSSPSRGWLRFQHRLNRPHSPPDDVRPPGQGWVFPAPSTARAHSGYRKKKL